MGGRLKSLRESLQTRKIISSTFPKGPQFFPVHVQVITHGKTLGWGPYENLVPPSDEGVTRIQRCPQLPPPAGTWFWSMALTYHFQTLIEPCSQDFLFLNNIFKMWRADQIGLEVNRMRLRERNWHSCNLHNYQRLAMEVQGHGDSHNEGEFRMGDERRESMAQLELVQMNFVHSKKEGVLVMANLRSMVSLYSPIILSRSAWNSPIRSFSFFRWLFVIVVRVRSVGVPSSHPFTRRLATLPLSSCSSSPLIVRAIFVTCAISASMRSRRAFIACARCTPLLSSFASWSFASNSLMLSIWVLIFSISAKNRVKSLSPPMLVICTLGPVSKSSS